MAEDVEVTETEQVTEPQEEQIVEPTSEEPQASETPTEEATEEPTTEPTEEPTEETKPTEPEQDLSQITEQEEATDVLKDKGFDYAALQEEYATTGEISKETRAKLTEAGIPDEIVDNYVEGCKAKAEKEIDTISECIGGRKSFDEVIKWATVNLDESEKISLNSVRDVNVLKIVLKDLKGRMEEQLGKTPETITETSGGSTSATGYRSKAEMMAAIKDPKYRVDPAYREDVQTKIAASREAGIDLGLYY